MKTTSKNHLRKQTNLSMLISHLSASRFHRKLLHLIIVLSLIIPLCNSTVHSAIAAPLENETSKATIANEGGKLSLKWPDLLQLLKNDLLQLIYNPINLLSMQYEAATGPLTELVENPANDRLAIQVDGTVEEFGRFNMGSQSGWDLIYRWPNPPSTSFTTLRVDGNDTIYGASSGQILQAPTNLNPLTNESKWAIGEIETTQILEITDNYQTGEADVAKISYKVKNTGTQPHNIGLRFMVDTEINNKDGAPFRIPGEGIITTEQDYSGFAVPDYFQVFYNVDDAEHVASATLRGGEATPPDRLVLAYWGDIYDVQYDYAVTTGKSITGDSAYALYWNPTSLAPGETRTYVTYYGLGQFDSDLTPPLALGVAGPASLSMPDGQYSPNPFDVTATITNVSGVTAEDVTVTLNLPNGLSLYAGSAVQSLGDLPDGSERQITWSVRARPHSVPTSLNYSVTVTATNATPKTVDRTISLPSTEVPDDPVGPGEGEECLGSPLTQSQGFAGGPINTRTGEMSYSTTDISIQTTAGTIEFSRSYSSAAIDTYTDLLGSGWTHNLISKLIFPGDPGGVTDRVILKGFSTNLYRFAIAGDGEYIAFPGISATLTRQDGTPVRYIITDCQQRTYTFDETGKLIERQDAQGHKLTYSYQNGQLDRVADEEGTRYLTITYNQGKIATIADQTGRSVSYGYNSTTGDLESVTDVRDYLWTYRYDDPAHPHFLTHIIDPDQNIIERTEYDSQGRAFRQFNGSGELTLELTYNSGQTTIIDGLGHSQTHSYDDRKTLTSETGSESEQYTKIYDGNFRPSEIRDALGHTTNLVWSEDGFDLVSATDALNNTTDYEYDSKNRLILVTDAGGKQTRFIHNTPGAQNPLTGEVIYNSAWDEDLILLTIENYRGSSSGPDVNVPTRFFYTSATDAPEPANLVRRIQSPDSSTCYAYNAFGQQTHLYENCVDMDPATGSTSEDVLSSYTFDSLGRLETITDPSGHVTRNIYYTNDDRVDATIRNYNAAKTPYEGGLWNLATVYVYDATGRQTDTITNAYNGDLNGNSLVEPDLVLDINRDGTPEYQLEIDPDQPEYNKISHMNYDAAGRLTESIANYWPGQPANYQELYNQSSQTVYDSAGNVIASIQLLPGCIITPGQNAQGEDTLSLSDACLASRTYYDASNRPISNVQNWKGSNLLDPTPPQAETNTPDQNVRSDTVYDPNGNAIAAISVLPGCIVTRSKDAQGNPQVEITSACLVDRTYYDALNRPEFTVRNLVGKPLMEPAYNSEGVLTLLSLARTSDQNLMTQTVYDSVGRVIAIIAILPGCTVDRSTTANGKYTYSPNLDCTVTRTYYDDLGRAKLTVQNLTGQLIDETITEPPAYISPDQNVPSGQPAYDGNGRNIADIDPLGRITRTYFDELNRPVKVTRNLRDPLNPGATIDDLLALANPPGYSDAHPDWNITAETRYDSHGRAIASIDVLGHVTRTYYDKLGRAYLVTRNLKDINNPDATVDQLLALTDPPGFDSSHPDWNLTTRTVYNVAGQAIASINMAFTGCVVTPQADGTVTASPACKVTRMFYDALGRNYAVVQNLTGQAISDPSLPSNNDANPTNNLTAETNRVTYSIYNAAGWVIATVESSPSCEVSWNPDQTVMIGSDCVVNRVYYDELGRTQSIVKNLSGQSITVDTPPVRNPATPDQNVRTDLSYDHSGNQSYTTDPNGVVTFFKYDRQGRLTDVYENYLPGVNPTKEINVHTIYSYDSEGNRLSIQSAKSVLSGTQDLTTFSYDALGRLERETDALSHTWRYGYNILGLKTSQWDAYDLETKFVYDGVDRLERIDYPAPDADVVFTYGANQQRKTMTDGLGTTTWAYDGVGRVTGVIDPFSKVVGYGYDGQGNRTKLVYPDQKEVNYTYDGLNHLEAVTDWQSQQTQYTYDYDGNGRARVVRLVGGITSTAVYDPLGRLTDLTHTWNGASLAAYHYTYDPAGNRKQAIEDLSQSSSPTQFTAEAQGYMAIRLSWPDSSFEETGYYLDRSTDGQHWQRIADLPANTLSYVDEGLARHTRYDYRLTAYDPETSQTLTTNTSFDPIDYSARTANPATTHTVIDYTYDPLSRLTAADYSSGPFFHYEYDANGNRTAETTPLGRVESAYDAANRLSSVGGVSYTWDDNGNLTGDGTSTYVYDRANRLVQVTQTGISTDFGYNGMGDRLVENGMQFVMDLNSGLTQTLQVGGNTYLYGYERILQQTEVDSAYFLGDALGSVRQLVDENGSVGLVKSYEPYGKVQNSIGNGTSQYGFTGEWASSLNLVYLRSRFYSSYLNQFIQPDPIVPNYADPQSLNLYSYGRNNPVRYTDPSGLTPYEPPDPTRVTRNDRDLTWWFYKELTTNVNSYYVQRIRTLLSGSIQEKSDAINGWIYLVKDRAKWDFKHKIDLEMKQAITFMDNNEGYRWYEYSVPGNIFYGYIGSAAGFSGLMLHAGASLAEVTDPAHSKKEIFGYEFEVCCPCPKESLACKAVLCGYYNPAWIGGGFDDPTDYNGVQFGVELYRRYREGLTFDGLIESLTLNGDKLAHPTATPSTFVWINPRSGWPYEFGRFNGPDDQLNEPKVLDYLK